MLLKVKPVVRAREHDAVNGDLRRRHKHDDHAEDNKRQCGIDATEQKCNAIDVQQREWNERAAQQSARREIRMRLGRIYAAAEIELNRKQSEKRDSRQEDQNCNADRVLLKRRKSSPPR